MPYFMIGTQRSGSNLLRVMINQSPQLVAPHPPHFLERLGPLLPAYGDLSEDANFLSLIDDVILLIDTNPVSWDIGKIDRQTLLETCPERSLVALTFQVHDLLAQAVGARDWVCKSLANVHYADEIARFGGSKAKFIHLHRDGRDVAVSFRKAIVGEKSAYHIAKQWQEEQDKALALQKKIPAEQFISVRYADLVRAPRDELQKLCDFMEIDFLEQMLEFHKSREAITTSQAGQMWSNVQKPIMSENVSKFLRELSLLDVSVFEAVAGEALTALDYPLTSSFQEENERLKAKAMETADPDDLQRRSAQARALQDIKNRLKGDQLHVA